MTNKIRVGSVIYDPKVTIIWGIISDFFKSEGLEIECIFYKDYKMQVDGLINAEIDIAWNSPLAWLDAHLRTDGKCLLGSMRDTDNDRSSYFIVRSDAGINKIEDLKGKLIGFGAFDSPQARLIPINFLHKNSLEYKKDYKEKVFNTGFGLHGDHVGGELDAMNALVKGEVDASVCLDLNFKAWQRDGIFDKNKIICIEKTPLFDHCIFVGHPDFSKERFNAWHKILHKMDYNNKEHKEMMDMEGLKKWVPGRVSGYSQISQANTYLNFLKEDGNFNV